MDANDGDLMPLLTLTVGNTEIKPAQSSDEYEDTNSDSSVNKHNDPNRINAYLNRGSELWTHWTWLGGTGKMSLMRCNYCLVNKQLKNAPKCRRHLIKCVKTPELVRKYFEKKEIEATRVSAFMREIRSKEVKFHRNEKQLTDDKVPVPTANDLKHLQQKQQQASINNVIVKQNGNSTKNSNGSSNGHSNSLLKTPAKNHDSDVMHKNILMNYSPLINRVKSESNSKKDSKNSPPDDTMLNDLGLIYQLMGMGQLSPDQANGNGHSILSNRLKRKLSNENLPHGYNGNNTNKENNRDNQANKMSNTVIINLDDVNSMDDSLFYGPMDTNHNGSMNGSRKKKRDSNGVNGYASNKSDRNNSNDNCYKKNYQHDFSNLDSQDLEIVNDDLNDLLASALITFGVDFEFVHNSYFQKFITQLVNFSSANKNYRLPTPDKLSTVNLSNLIRKFDYETTKIFCDCESIIISFDSNKESNVVSSTTRIDPKDKEADNSSKGGTGNLNVNLFITSANSSTQLFYKSISSSSQSSFEQSFETSSLDDNLKSLNNQIDSLINKIGSDRINAVILPYEDSKSCELIYLYLSGCHNHIVPLTNSYQLFHHLLCDICKIPSISKLLTQCMTLFREFESNFTDFQEENQKHWKQVFQSDNLKIYEHFLNNEATTKNTYWISLNLMLCWFLVAQSSITKRFEMISDDSSNSYLKNILDKIELDENQMDDFFKHISVLFNFLTPFINAIHLIENESSVISDIVKIYFDIKLTINNNNFFKDINLICDKMERQAIDSVLNKYLQEQNFSRYFFLSYYLDPRFRDDKRIEENEELIAQVYDALFCYANALGCVSSEEEDREKLLDSLDQFRNSDKLYGMQLLKCPKSPVKFWKHLLRFPGSAKLAYCASRLLSISTRSMLLAAPSDDPCTSSLYQRILNHNENEIDLIDMEKVLPVKSYLLSRCQKANTNEEGLEESFENGTVNENGGSCGDAKRSVTKNTTTTNINNIITNVINSLDQYSTIIAQPLTSDDLSCLVQPSN